MSARQIFSLISALFSLAHGLPAQAVGRNAATRDSARKRFAPLVTHDDFEKATLTTLRLQSIGFLPNRDKQNINIDCGIVGDVSLYLVHSDKLFSGHSMHTYVLATSSGSQQFEIDGSAELRLVSGDSVVALRPAEAKLTYFESATSDESGQRVAYGLPQKVLRWIGSRPYVKVRVPGRSANCDFSIWDVGLDMVAMFDSVTRSSSEERPNAVKARKRPR